MNDRHQSSPHDDSRLESFDPSLENLLDDWGRLARGDHAADRVADRVFEASRSAISVRRAARDATPRQAVGGTRPAYRRSPLRPAWYALLPARFALAAGVLAALLLPATLDLDGSRESSTELALAASTTLEAAEPLGGMSASEPLLLAMMEPGTASWEDVVGHQPGVDLYAVLESGRAGLDDYLSELDAIFGTLDGAGEEM